MERAEREVVVLVGVPLVGESLARRAPMKTTGARRVVEVKANQKKKKRTTYGISEGVSGLDAGACGILISIGCAACDGCCILVVSIAPNSSCLANQIIGGLIVATLSPNRLNTVTANLRK